MLEVLLIITTEVNGSNQNNQENTMNDPNTVNWHEENKKARSENEWHNLVSYYIIVALTELQAQAKQKGEEPTDIEKKFIEATKNLTECKLTMQINGIELPATAMLEHMFHGFDHAVAQEAKRIIKESTSLNKIYDTLQQFQWKIEEELKKAFPDIVLSDD